MTLAVLRRFTRTESIPITATPPTAPVVEAAAPSVPRQPDRPPTYAVGLCWHKVHAYFDGVRYGVSPQRGATPHGQLFQLATLTPCEHLSRTGR